MISYIRGELAETGENGIVVEAGGVGYEIRVPLTVLSELPPVGEEVKVFTYHHVWQDGMQLYGFLSRDDRAVFEMLLGVSGIGPKAALSILSGLSADDLKFAILSDDVKTISQAPGIGAKTAKKLILELKDKLQLSDAFEQKLAAGNAAGAAGKPAAGAAGIREEAVQALVTLGYTSSEAAKAVHGIEITDGTTVEEVLKLCLKRL